MLLDGDFSNHQTGNEIDQGSTCRKDHMSQQSQTDRWTERDSLPNIAVVAAKPGRDATSGRTSVPVPTVFPVMSNAVDTMALMSSEMDGNLTAWLLLYGTSCAEEDVESQFLGCAARLHRRFMVPRTGTETCVVHRARTAKWRQRETEKVGWK